MKRSTRPRWHIKPKRLRELLFYDPKTGKFTWLRRIQGVLPSMAAGSTFITVDGHLYSASKLAWLYMTDEWPPDQINYIDKDSTNHRWDNLRLATPTQISWTRRKPSNNTSGYKGVSFDKRLQKYRAQIGIDRKTINLGSYETAEEAAMKYRKVARQEWGEFARFE